MNRLVCTCLIAFVLITVWPCAGHTPVELEPGFAEPIPNVTIKVGSDAKLTCVVNRLGSYRVAWLRVESKTILTIHRHVITRNYRITLSHSDNKNWILHINNVQQSDIGGYMCQINTVPMKSQVGFLDVVVPPDIIDTDSSSDVLVREGSNVTLTCRARGYPTPTIAWRREDNKEIGAGNWQNSKYHEKTHVGEELNIVKVSRLHMGAYLCIASNNVPPSVSRRIMLQVNFPPMIWIPNQRVGAPIGNDVTLGCHTEAYPMSINYWTKEDGDVLISNDKYVTGIEDNTYKVQMNLTIKNVQPEDFGSYKCYAKNSLGSTEGSIRVDEIHASPQPVKEPSTAKIQSMDEDDQGGLLKHNSVLRGSAERREEGRYGMSDDSLTKERNLAYNPSSRNPNRKSDTNKGCSCKRLWQWVPFLTLLTNAVTFMIPAT